MNHDAGHPRIVAALPTTLAAVAGPGGVRIDVADGGAPQPGWYELRVKTTGHARIAPAWRVELAPGGRGDPGTLPLPAAAADGERRLVLALADGVRGVRLQPGPGQERLDIVSATLKPITRGAALRHLAATLGAGAVLRLPALLVRALVGGSRAAGEQLVRLYQDRLAATSGWQGQGDYAGRVPLRLDSDVRHLDPAHQLRRRPGGNDDEWEATGEDPQYVLRLRAGEAPLRAGWYRFRARIDVQSGQVISPCFYPDYGEGFRAENLILLPDPLPDGQLCSLVLFKYDVHALRFDPSLRRCRFGIDAVSLARMGKPMAFLRMLDGIRDGGGQRLWGEAMKAVGQFVMALRRGSSAGAAVLFERYQHHCRQGAVSYDAWVRLHDTLSESDVEQLRRRAATLPRTPLVSLVLPVYDTPERWLRRCLDSVLAQAWPHWELCIADDASPSPRVREVLREYERRDPRIRVTYRDTNGHIAAASNTALAMARGEFIGLLDHDDELRPHALLEMVQAIQADPGVRLLYSDEDKIDGEGRRFQPYFKPDWNPDLLLGQNYLCHFSVLQTALVREVGGFRTGFEGSQDHDLLLRCSERLAPEQVRHVPRVLYHWRAIEGSTALRRDAKDYAADAGARAVDEHLQRIGAAAAVEQLPHGHFRVRWELPAPAPRATLIIPTRDRLELLRTCINSIHERTRYPDYRILVVDNGSVEPETLAWLEKMRTADRIDVLRDDQPFNYARLNNAAVAACAGDVVALVNNDIEVIAPDWLAEMVGLALRPGVGAVGAMLYYPDDTIQHAGVILGIGGVANHAYIRQPRGHAGHGGRAKVVQALSAVTGACLVVRRDTYLAAGGLDERLQVAFNDVDFCLRLRERGLRNLWTPFAELYHHESASRGREDSAEKLQRFHGEVRQMEARWADVLMRDPAYNPNLSLDSFNFDLAFPPRHHPGPTTA